MPLTSLVISLFDRKHAILGTIALFFLAAACASTAPVLATEVAETAVSPGAPDATLMPTLRPTSTDRPPTTATQTQTPLATWTPHPTLTALPTLGPTATAFPPVIAAAPEDQPVLSYDLVYLKDGIMRAWSRLKMLKPGSAASSPFRSIRPVPVLPYSMTAARVPSAYSFMFGQAT